MVVYHLQKTIDENGLNVDIFEGPGGIFQIRHREYGDEPSFSVTSNIAGILTQEANMAEFSIPGLDVAGTIANETARGDGQFLTAMEGTAAQGIKIQFDRDIQLGKFLSTKNKQFQYLMKMETKKGPRSFRFESELNLFRKPRKGVGSPENPKIEGYVTFPSRPKKSTWGQFKEMKQEFH